MPWPRPLTLWPWPLTFDLKHLQRMACDVIKMYQIWTQSSNPRRSYCDFSVWPYDLEHVLRVALGSGIIFTKFDLRQLIRAWIIAFFDANTLCHAVTLTFDLLILNFYSTSSVMRHLMAVLCVAAEHGGLIKKEKNRVKLKAFPTDVGRPSYRAYLFRTAAIEYNRLWSYI